MGKEMQRVNVGRKRQRFSKEFKLSAVKLLQAGPKSGTLLALELGIRRNLRYQWAETVHRHAGTTETVFNGHGRRTLGLRLDPLKAENARLKRELARITEERDILKKPPRTLPNSPREVRLHPTTPPAASHA